MIDAAERLVRAVMHDGVEVAEQKEPAGATSANPADQVRRVVGRGAWDALHLGLGRHERRGQRDALLRRVHVPRR